MTEITTSRLSSGDSSARAGSIGLAEFMRATTSLETLRLSRGFSESEERPDFAVKCWGLIARKIWEWRSFCIMVVAKIGYSCSSPHMVITVYA